MKKLHLKKRSMITTYYLLCILIILITLISFFVQMLIMRNTLLENTRQLLRAAHQQSYENINHYLNNLENIAVSLGYNGSVQRYMKEEDPVKRLAHFPDVKTVFSGFSMSQNDLQGFAVYDKNGEFVVSNGKSYQSIIQNDAINLSNRITYSSSYPSNPYIGVTVPYYIITIPVLDLNTINLSDLRIGTILLTMNQTYITAQIETGNQLKGCNMILVDSDGHEIAGYGQTVLSIDDILKNKSYVVIENTFTNNNWQLITYYEKGIIADNMIPLLLAVIITSALIVIMVLTFVIFLLKQFIHPINHISHFMGEVSRKVSKNITKKIPPYHLPHKWNYEELSSMTLTMNHMLQSLDEKTSALISKEKQYYETALTLQRTEILAYRNQINPHFLYNTFECIKGIALSRNVSEICEISQALSEMFRYAVKGDNFVTVSLELNHLKDYASIIHYRFMGRITINIQATEEALHFYMPRLILQPIVENAVFHGVESQIEEGNIDVVVSIDNNFLHITISDNGVGMDAITIKTIEQNFQNMNYNTGIGLANIAYRLKLFYSDSYDIKISSKQGSGTSIEVMIPAKKEVPDNV